MLSTCTSTLQHGWKHPQRHHNSNCVLWSIDELLGFGVTAMKETWFILLTPVPIQAVRLGCLHGGISDPASIPN